MTIKLSMPKMETELKPRITVVGVGGAGGNAVNNMIQSNLDGVDFVVCNTDAQALSQSQAERKIQIGVSITQGLGAGTRPEIGRAAAEEALEEILDHLAGSHMVFVTAGMGGGTGTGAGPVIARATREHGILTVGVVTKPFHFEGATRMKVAEGGIEDLQQYVDTLIIIPNQNLFRVANEQTTFAEAFRMADNVLYSGVRGVTDLMVMPGLINLDFADVRTVMGEMGKAMMGTGEAEGEGRAIAAAEAAISNPLLDDITMQGAKGVLINITGGPDMTLFEVDEAANRIRDEVDSDANIVFGSTFDETIEGKLRVSVVATGIEADANAAPRPMPLGLSSMPRRRPDAAPAAEPTPAAEAKPPAAAAKPAAEVKPAPRRTATAVAKPVTEVKPAAEAKPSAAEASPAAEVEAPKPTAKPEPAPAAAPEAAPEPAAAEAPMAPEAEAAEPAPAERGAFVRSEAKRAPFIPPPAAKPQDKAGSAPSPEPFAAAAMENARSEPASAAKRPSLFERMTGAGRDRTPEPTPETQPEAAEAPAQTSENTLAAALEDKAENAAKPLSGPGPDDRAPVSQAEEEMLDIPAFLRRQAN
ncbi:MAG: cell division protein FtsZ [Alphaproteobacteria bacterium]|nr:cell division protein FtsZ [Alphaproteobacteria bacterium]